MAKIDVKKLSRRTGSGYPTPFDLPVAGRSRRQLGDAGGMTQFGVNLLELAPGAWSSQRHWHTNEDEFVYVLSGEVTLVTDAGEEKLRAGDCAGFPRNTRDGHHLINRSRTKTAVCLEVGTRVEVDYIEYPDIDMVFDTRVDKYARRDGTLYPPKRSRAIKAPVAPKPKKATPARRKPKATAATKTTARRRSGR